ncbi:MAG TPA: hypothetical protein VK206_13255 [Anaerolineales bacterium]|nr:hypothetical protein [Anaerolineales bacterium]
MASYKLFDKNDNIVNPGELQNRAIWYQHGVSKEQVFVNQFGPTLDVRLNPEKEQDATLPDLLHKKHLADLKCQDTPFFRARKYQVDPTYAVTFNLKDMLQYGKFGKNYRDFTIFYWVDWVAVRMEMNNQKYSALPLSGVWRVSLSQLDQMCQSRPIHWYNQRARHYEISPQRRKLLLQFEPRLKDGENVWAIRGLGDNAACSYVFDLRDFEKVG